MQERSVNNGLLFPLKGFQVGLTANDKPNYKITSYEADHVEIRDDGKVVTAFDSSISPYSVKSVHDYIDIPCGRCIGCRLAYSRQWADRCMLELGYHEQSWFVTFTYDDDHLPVNEVIDPESGEVSVNATLVKRDVQLFMKRLRKNYKYDNDIRYFFAGEYGSQTFRPHYHAILFGLKLDDLKLYKQSMEGYNYYNSEFLSKCWQNKGHVVVGEVTWDTCAYTARYIMKKQYGSAADIYERYNILPEFTLMSLKPAIGRRYYDEHKEDIYNSDYIFVGTKEGSHKIKPPKYYDKLFDVEYPDDSVIMKEQRKRFVEDMNTIKLQSTSLPYLSMLANEELVKQNQIRMLKRKEF
ncbi:replication initiator protein [Microvirus mar30]|uniref:Replication initiator protein n=1 Tax=Microvirus mar30 TaxID=2851164 RepID=A0A8F5MIX6_9VIRU|nr:replication initiator protein [Microvirus mar30]